MTDKIKLEDYALGNGGMLTRQVAEDDLKQKFAPAPRERVAAAIWEAGQNQMSWARLGDVAEDPKTLSADVRDRTLRQADAAIAECEKIRGEGANVGDVAPMGWNGGTQPLRSAAERNLPDYARDALYRKRWSQS